MKLCQYILYETQAKISSKIGGELDNTGQRQFAQITGENALHET